MIENIAPTTHIQIGKPAGTLKANNKPVTTAEKSLIVDFFFVILQYTHSEHTAPITQAKIVIKP